MQADIMPLSDTPSWLVPLIFAGLALFFFLFRKIIAGGLLHLILTPVRRRYPPDYPGMRQEMINPLGLFLAAAFFAAACHLAYFIPAPWSGFLTRLADSLLTAVAFWFLYRLSALVGFLVRKGKGHPAEGASSSAVSLLVSMIRVLVLFVGALVILSYWVSNVAGLITGLGIGGLAVSLAAQDTISNFIGGIAISLEQPFQLGDWISTPDASGTVESIGIRSSRLRASSGAQVSVPNKTLAASVITNESRRERRRIEIEVTLPWELAGSSYDLFREKLETWLKNREEILEPVIIAIRNLKPEGQSLYISCYTGAAYAAMLETRDGINRALAAILDELGMSLEIAQPVRLEREDAILKNDAKHE